MPTDRSGPVDLTRQIRLHLEALQAAGVLFVPRPAPLAHAPLRVAATQVVAQPVETPREEDPFEVRRRELEVLSQEVAACDKCSELFSTRLQTVFGTGPLDAEIAFVGP